MTKEEEARTEKHAIRIVMETDWGDNLCRSTILAELDLTLEQRERMIANLAWLRRDY